MRLGIMLDIPFFVNNGRRHCIPSFDALEKLLNQVPLRCRLVQLFDLKSEHISGQSVIITTIPNVATDVEIWARCCHWLRLARMTD